MTAHELARALLDGPDREVWVMDDEYGPAPLTMVEVTQAEQCTWPKRGVLIDRTAKPKVETVNVVMLH